VRLGLVGAGAWGRNYIDTVAALPAVRLAGVAGRHDWRSLIETELDGLIIATPTATHAEIASAAMERGLHVLIEKPLTMDVAQARALARQAAAMRLTAMVEHTQLFHPGFRALKSVLAELGPLRAIRSRAGRIGPFRADTPPLWDWGSHDIAMCLDVMSAKPLRSSAMKVATARHGADSGESIQIELEFPAAVRATLLVSNILAVKTRRFEALCERGTVVYDQHQSPGVVLVNERPTRYVAEPPLTVAVREFAESIAAGRSDARSLELGVSVVEVLSECAASIARATGRGTG